MTATIAPPKPVRHEPWVTHLHTFLRANAKTPFKWGVWDCSLFCADAIKAMTGIDIASDFRGLYTDEAGAKAAVEKVTGVTGGTVEDAAAYCAAKHGLVEWKHPLFAQRGDLVVLEDAGRVITGLVHLSGRHIVAAGESGLRKFTITNVKRAWHV
ncbi:MAG TPA: hypothetical protein VII58_00805 [Acidobacteriaceae bacterium]